MGFKRCSKPPAIVNKSLKPIEVPGVRVGTSVHRSDLAYADDIVLLSSNYREVEGLLEAVNHHAAAMTMSINASKTKVMSALIPDEQRQVVLLDGESLDDADKRCSSQTAREPKKS